MRKNLARMAAALTLVTATTFFALPATPAAAWMSGCVSYGYSETHQATCSNGTGEVRSVARCFGLYPNAVPVWYNDYGPWVSAGYYSEGDCWRWYLVYVEVTDHKYETRN